MLLNLSLNAVTAAKQRCEVNCLLDQQHRQLSIVVTNDGQQIKPEQLAHLFEPFMHFSDRGNGLGLWVTYQLVQQLNGDIEVNSVDGQTEFSVRLPLPVAA